ncbi:MAG: hypothetical protein Q9M92_12975 [Enterobacterales bacterium]|nr:hypothetical protein [Enterobacterales bacterium]
MNQPLSIGIVGVRGYVGRELLALLANRSDLKVVWVSSRQLKGQTFESLLQNDSDYAAEFIAPSLAEQHYFQTALIDELSPQQVASKQTDIVILALPNGLAADYVSAIEKSTETASANTRLIIDLSADYRFDDHWSYLLPELADPAFIKNLQSRSTMLISNPGCYATAMQLAIAPIKEQIKGTVHCFGISGFSGAGTNPSDNNNPDKLKNNIRPYALVEHLHEKEVAHQLQTAIRFSPHVASFFRGINMTLQVELKQAWTLQKCVEYYAEFYQTSPQIKVTESIPNVTQVVHQMSALVGGFSLDASGTRLSLVCCLDNLLKGAASQALQNICLAMQIPFDQA